jgi:hypothetical protein
MLVCKGEGCLQCLKDPKLIPCCEKRSIAGSLKLMKIWDTTNDVSPRDVFCGGTSKYKWKCLNTCIGQVDCNHEWEQDVHLQNKSESDSGGCPYCSCRTTPCCIKTSVAGNPNMMKFFDFEINTIDPKTVRCSSMIDIFWICPNVCNNSECSHKWKASLNSMSKVQKTNPNNGCRFCGKQEVCCKLKSVAMNPIIVESFDENHPKNEHIVLEKIFPKSDIVVWWKCHNSCIGQVDCVHSWPASVHKRTTERGCPYCVSMSEYPCCIFKSCANPKYQRKMKDFDFEKNYPLTPRLIFPGSPSLIQWKCRICYKTWESMMMNRIKSRFGKCDCSRSSKSNGELECMRILDSMKIEYECEFRLGSLKRKRFDFSFVWNKREYLLEFDGEPHFKPKYYNSNLETFKFKQEIDILKTLTAIRENYFIIRIDFKRINHIELEIKTAMSLGEDDVYYFSNPQMYFYILKEIWQHEND